MRIIFKKSYEADIRYFKDRFQASCYLLLLLVAIILPFAINEYWVGEFSLMLIWAIAGMGLMLLVGHTGQASLGHAAFMAVGAYTNVILQNDYNLPFILSLPLSGIFAGILGICVALPTGKLHGIYMAIATIAIGVLAEDLIVILEPWTGGVGGIYAPAINIFGIDFDRYTNVSNLYWLILTITVLIIIGYKNILRSPLGRSFVAVRDSEISAQAMGVNIGRTRTLSFAISCAITGVSGALMGHYSYVFTNETFNIVISINLLLMIVVGGIGFIHGAFLGAIVVTFLPSGISFTRDAFFSDFNVIPGIESGIFGLILIAVILFEPMGLYGRWLKIKTYFELFPFYRKDMFRRQKTYLKTERTR